MAVITMETAAGDGRAMLWTGRVLTGLFVLFMAFDIAIKLIDLPIVDATMAGLGWPAGSGRAIGALELVLLALYLAPRTAVLGAVLMTGLLGGAVATHVRIGDPLFSHVLFGVYLGLFAWGGLWLRDRRLRGLMPLARG
jgi:hypothetical protein